MTLSTEKFFILRGSQTKGSSMAPWVLNQVRECEGDVERRAQQFPLHVRNTGGRQRGQRRGAQDWNDLSHRGRGRGEGFPVLRGCGEEVAGTGVMGIIRGIPEEAPLARAWG